MIKIKRKGSLYLLLSIVFMMSQALASSPEVSDCEKEDIVQASSGDAQELSIMVAPITLSVNHQGATGLGLDHSSQDFNAYFDSGISSKFSQHQNNIKMKHQGLEVELIDESSSIVLGGNTGTKISANANYQATYAESFPVVIDTTDIAIKVDEEFQSLNDSLADGVSFGDYQVSTDEIILQLGQIQEQLQQDLLDMNISETVDVQAAVDVNLDVSIENIEIAAKIKQEKKGVMFAIPLGPKWKAYLGDEAREDSMLVAITKFDIKCSATITGQLDITNSATDDAVSDFNSSNNDCSQSISAMTSELKASESAKYRYNMIVVGVGYKSKTGEFKLVMDAKRHGTRNPAISNTETFAKIEEEKKNKPSFLVIAKKCSASSIEFCIGSELEARAFNSSLYTQARVELDTSVKYKDYKVTAATKINQHLLNRTTRTDLSFDFPVRNKVHTFKYGKLTLSSVQPLELENDDTEILASTSEVDGNIAIDSSVSTYTFSDLQKTQMDDELTLMSYAVRDPYSKYSLELYGDENGNTAGYTLSMNKALSTSSRFQSAFGLHYSKIDTGRFVMNHLNASYFLRWK